MTTDTAAPRALANSYTAGKLPRWMPWPILATALVVSLGAFGLIAAASDDDVNWIGGGDIDQAVGDGLEMFVKVRSTRAAQPAWLRRVGGGYEVELADGEEGVSPGQACVFYDAPAGQARVLGGGFISAAQRSLRPMPALREALAG